MAEVTMGEQAAPHPDRRVWPKPASLLLRLDVVYGPGRPEGEALSELLTRAAVVESLDRASVPMAAGGEPSSAP